jgi:hypothetical protein
MGFSPSSWAGAISLAILLPTALADYQQVIDDHCDCYLTNGTNGGYFTSHKFFDFRSMSQHVNVPSVISNANDASQAPVADDYFSSQAWNDTWGIQQWNNTQNMQSGDAAVFMVNSPSNVYIEQNSDRNANSETHLTLRTVRTADFQSAAEFESINQGYHFVSARMYARTVGAPGAITAMFTYRGSDDPNLLQEADLEIRTMDPPEVIQYTNQPSYSRTGDAVAASTRNATVPVGWDQWAIHRMDWSPTSTMWYVDGVNVSQIEFQTPRDPSIIIFNSWSDGAAWSGNMTDGAEAYLQIQWIELVYNSTQTGKSTDPATHRKGRLSERADASGCKRVCSIDETKTIGTAVLLQGGAGHVGLGGPVLWAPVLAVVMFVFF